jgi:hypothetical protein
MRFGYFPLLMGSIAALLVLPAAAANSAPTAKGTDPNERICENITLTGSRLATKRICATRAQWAERLRLDREAIDQAQRAANPPCATVNTHSGAPTC